MSTSEAVMAVKNAALKPRPEYAIPFTKKKSSASSLEKIINSRKLNLNYDSQRIIDSKRYVVCLEDGKPLMIGQGQWGEVYRFYDKLSDEFVAIKILRPQELALNQMDYRNKDTFTTFLNEGGKRKSRTCAHVVPSDPELDKQNRPFYVMPEYYAFFTDVMEAASKRDLKKEESLPGPYGDQKPFKSGLYIDEIIGYFEHMVSSIAEFHKKYNRVLCDFKNDNLAVEVHTDADIHDWNEIKKKVKDDLKERQPNGLKVLVGDKGTSTFASINSHSGPRDNMGCAYTRSLRLFLDGVNPERKDDAYALGCQLYELFEGKYPFQEEIDAFSKQDGVDKIKEFAGNFFSMIGRGLSYSVWKLSNTIDDKLEKTIIPPEFRNCIKNFMMGYCHDGKEAVRRFEEAKIKYIASIAKKDATKELKKTLKVKLLNGLIAGTVLAGLGIGVSWLGYIGPKPDYANKTDIITRSQIRSIDKSGVILKIDHPYTVDEQFGKKGDDYDNILSYHTTRFKNKSIIDKIVTIWIKTGSEVGTVLVNKNTGEAVISPVDYLMRHSILYPNTGGGMPGYFLNENVRDLLSYGMDVNQLEDNVVDLENAIATTYLGDFLKYKAQRAANSFKLDQYVGAKNPDGTYIIPENRQKFLIKLMYNITNDKELSQNIRLK